MAVAYSAIANGGTVWQPQIAEEIRSPSGGLVQPAARRATSRHVAIDPLRPAARHGRACTRRRRARRGTSYAVFGNFPRTVYGKTGTAVHDGQGDQSWYVGYVPDARSRS